MLSNLSPQAKAIASAVLTFLAQVSVVVGSGGLDVIGALTIGQWISIVLLTATAYGFTYAVPNGPAVKVDPPVDPQV
jgi:hypothetical protein